MDIDTQSHQENNPDQTEAELEKLLKTITEEGVIFESQTNRMATELETDINQAQAEMGAAGKEIQAETKQGIKEIGDSASSPK